MAHQVDLIWADAICINQKDVEEENVQIPLMHDIFAKGEQTIVWLGESTPETDEVLIFLSSLEDHVAYGYHCSGFSHTVTATRFWQAVTSLLRDHTYWNRSWIVQEILVSRILYIQCGKHRVSWNCLRWLSQEQDRHR